MKKIVVRKSALLVLLFATLCFATGCEKGDPRSKGLVPAKGTVLYNGEPINEAVITFLSADPLKPGGSAVSKPDGSFSISMYGDGDGTNPGEYYVTVSKIEVKSRLTEEEILDYELRGEELPGDATEETSILPSKYASKNTTDIHVTIGAEGDEEIRLELKD